MSEQWQRDINQLIHRIQLQNKPALQQLYQITQARLLGLIMRIVKDQHEAEDVLQELFVKVWQQADQFRGRGSAWGWLCVMARHLAIDYLRQRQRKSIASIDDQTELVNELFETNNELDKHWIGRCLEKLKPDYRQVILLSFFNGQTHREMSEQLKTPLGTVKARVRRGLLELKKCLVA